MPFEVKNPQIEELLRALGQGIMQLLPAKWGFTLLIFDYSDPNKKEAGSMFYISSANRTDMIKSMMEFIDNQQKGQTVH